jgi:hypothetical protein
LQSYDTNEETLTNEHKPTITNTHISRYVVLFEQNLLARKNWIKLNEKQAKKVSKIDFSFTNLSKIQTNSIIHNRILLDTDHFISNKGFYYDYFKEYDFCPVFENINTECVKISNKFRNCLVILKPDMGASSRGIKVFNNCLNKYIASHIANFEIFKSWTISKLYMSRLYEGYIVTNRIFYLVRKTRNNNIVTFDGFWYDEFINYRALQKFENVENDEETEKFLKIFVTNYDSLNENFYKNRTIDYQTYSKIFTSSEHKLIKEKITNYTAHITKKIAEHAICSNDYTPNDDDINNINMTYHLYGIDSIIADDIDIKFIEINGAPELTGKGFDKINYTRLINEICKLTTDIIYEPKHVPVYSSGGTFVKCGQFSKELKTPVYFTKEIIDTYPFILNGFFNKQRSESYQRIKNPKSKSIHLFYGPRDLYVHNFTSYNYYDEIVEWNKSECGRTAKILNKIQGITYFLASKDKFHQTLYDCDFVPKSSIYNIGDNKEQLIQFIENIRKKNSDQHFIIKPVHGSQGKGIVIIYPDSPIEMFFNKIELIKNEFGYRSFAISVYINNPRLFNGKKFNLRFYFLLHIKKLPTCLDTRSDVSIYILKHVQVYFTVLPYDININNILGEFNKLCQNEEKVNMADKISNLTIGDIQKSIHITNFQIVKDLSKKLNISLPLTHFVKTLKDMNFDDKLYDDIISQAHEIIKTSINAVKFNIRPLNRLVKNSSAFNLLACDTMLDTNNKLHLIEMNRGPDLHGLNLTIGTEKITSIFSELFDIVIDNKQSNLIHFDRHVVTY